jgi:hypothetical protein
MVFLAFFCFSAEKKWKKMEILVFFSCKLKKIKLNHHIFKNTKIKEKQKNVESCVFFSTNLKRYGTHL